MTEVPNNDYKNMNLMKVISATLYVKSAAPNRFPKLTMHSLSSIASNYFSDYNLTS